MPSIIGLIISYKYLFIFFLSLWEGPATMLVGGFILKSGFLSLVPLAFTIATGDLIGDITLYWIGRRFGKTVVNKFSKYLSVTPEHVAQVERLLRLYHERIFLTTKTTTGFGMTPAILLTAGMAKVAFGRFITINAIGEIGRLIVYISIGFFFGNLYASITNGLEMASFIVLIVATAIIMFGFGKYVKGRVLG